MSSPSIGFDTEDDLMDYIMHTENITRAAGIIFKRDDAANELKVTLRFYSDTPWAADKLWDPKRTGVRNVHLSSGGMPPGYFPRGFVFVQNAIFNALNGQASTRVQMNRMPIKGYNEDVFVVIMTAFGAPLLVFCFFTSFSTNVKVRATIQSLLSPFNSLCSPLIRRILCRRRK